MSTKTGVEAAVQHRGDVGHPGDRRHDDLAAGRAAPCSAASVTQVGRRAGVDEDAVLHAEPVATTRCSKARTLRRLRQDRVVLLQQVA